MTDFSEAVAKAYTVDGGAIDLGRGVHEGTLELEAIVRLPLATMNRHGLIAGATGTGKTRTLQLLAEQLSDAGVSVFAADYKGDLSGLLQPGAADGPAPKRMTELTLPYEPTSYPVEFLALGGIGDGIPVRATVTDFGPELLGKVLSANETQQQTLSLLFRFADERGLLLTDLADLRALLTYLDSDAGKADLTGIGGVSSQTIGVLLRSLVELEDGGGNEFFGEPLFEIGDLLRTAPDGRGVISALELSAIQDRPALFSTALMWLLAELFEQLPEVGDLDKPKLVFFFDEAHLLFADATKSFLESVTRTVRHDPVQGRRRLLRDAVADGRAERGARPARRPGSARVARVHARGRRRAEEDGAHVSDVGVLRPRDAAQGARNGRGGRDHPFRARRTDAGRAHAPARAALEHDDGERCRSSRAGLPALREVRHEAREGQRRGAAREAGRAGGDSCRARARARVRRGDTEAQGARAEGNAADRRVDGLPRLQAGEDAAT